MKKQRFIVVMILVAVLCFPSCSGKKTKKDVEPRKPAPAGAEQKTSNAGTKKTTSVPTSIPVKHRTPAELLMALPCKLEGKKGIFAVFPDNPAAGQVCFSLYPARGNEPDIPKFDIQGGGMHIIFHDTTGSEPGDIKLMRWQERDGKPCLDAACGKEVTIKREIHNAPGEAGWTYIIVTPETPIDFASVSGEYYGIFIGADKYLPLFQ
ncbi:MAG: hypothetical protein AB1546_07190 [bacterium]